jgi:NAD(P)-dependent dehydrogenase (short-subunit alcohol dehydrogenase family)
VHPFAGAAYATSKAALASLTREMAAEFRPARHPRQRHRAGRDRHLDPVTGHGGDRGTRSVASPRHPDEVAKIIVLCTETSSYVNGAEIHINGGQHV